MASEIKSQDNLGNEYTIKDGKLYKPNGEEYIVNSYKDMIRPLNDDELGMYTSAVLYSTKMLPSFRDAISLLHPFFDLSSTTAYTDRNARCGLGPWFFSSELDGKKRASILLHECMHVLNNHFTRSENYGQSISQETMNIAGDFEINCALDSVAMVDLSFAIFPNKAPFAYPENLLMEEYFPLLKKDQDEQNKCPDCDGTGVVSDDDKQGNKDQKQQDDGSQSDNKGKEKEGSGSDKNEDTNSQGGQDSKENQKGDGFSNSNNDGEGEQSDGNEGSNSGNGIKPCPTCKGSGKSGKGEGEGSGCGVANEGREKAADDAGIEKASETEKKISQRNTRVRVAEERNKAKQAGNGHMANFYENIFNILSPPKVDWRRIVSQITSTINDVVTRGRQDYSYRRVNRRFANSKYIYPGMIKYEATWMFGIDASGSMADKDYMVTLSEVEEIIKNNVRGKNKLKIFTVDTEISNIQTVSSIKEIDLVGGGGTRMATAFEYVNTLRRKDVPDVFVLSTDAELFGRDWDEIIQAIKNAPVKYVPIILVTENSSINNVPKELKAIAKVIDVSN